MTILNCPRVLNDNGDYESVSVQIFRGSLYIIANSYQRWFVKGTFNCFTGRHILLGLSAIFLLLICVLLIPLLALVAVGKLEVCNSVKM